MKTYGTGFDYEEFKKVEAENRKEILPGLLQIKSTEEGKADTYIFKLLIPIAEIKTIVLTEHTPDIIKSNFNLLEDKSYEEILKVPEIDLSNLSFDTLSSKFQETTEKIKQQFENIFNKK